MTTPKLRLIRDPRAVWWETFTDLGLPHSLALNWLDMPNDGEPGDLMPGILWEGFAALGLTNILFSAAAEDIAGAAYRHFAKGLALAEGQTAFLGSFDMDGLDSWFGGQCYFAMPPGRLPARSDPELTRWGATPVNTTTKGEPPFPSRVPENVAVLVKVQHNQDAAWAVAFADSALTRTAFETALVSAARAAGVEVTQPAERDLFSDDVWARYGPRT